MVRVTRSGKLTLDAEQIKDFVAVRAEHDGESFDVPMTPDVAEQWCVMVMIAVEKARAWAEANGR